MENFWFDFLSKQLPVIVVLGIFCYGMYRYFIVVITKKDEIIKSKDEEIKHLYEQLIDLNERMINAFNLIKRQ